MKIMRHNNVTDFALSASREIASKIAEQIKRYGNTSLFLSGGTSPVPVYNELKKNNDLDWSRVIIGMGDERWSPHDPEILNTIMIAETLYTGSILPASCFHAIPLLENPLASADYYSRQIASVLNGNPAGVVLLGLGPDGHTASLFPGFSCESAELFVSVPAPPVYPQVARISCSYSFLSRARSIIFLARSAGKEEVLDRVLSGDTTYPAARASENPRAEWIILDE
ncbi:MAG: 6-phosphogluconolactonase [Spirochaetales bacterium]|nr:6-phosphogluconolactonase [Spirochaetales bacterium]